jgi:ribosomal protein S17
VPLPRAGRLPLLEREEERVEVGEQVGAATEGRVAAVDMEKTAVVNVEMDELREVESR